MVRRGYTPWHAGVIQLVECQLPKLDVVGSSPIARSSRDPKPPAPNAGGFVASQKGPTVVRPAGRADLAAIGRLGALLVGRHHELDPLRFLAPTADTASGYGGYLGSRLSSPDALVLVAERDGAVVGYAFAAVEGHDWMALRGPAGVLHDIVVDPAERGRGIGIMLLRATLAALEARGVPRVVLSTAARNEAAQRFFARAGFRPTMVEFTREAHTGETAPG